MAEQEQYPTSDYDPMVEEPVEETGDPIDVKGVVYPKVMVVDIEIEGIRFLVQIPHSKFDVIEFAAGLLPQALQGILEQAADQRG